MTPVITNRATGNSIDLNFSRKKWVIIFWNKNRKLVKRMRFFAIGFGKLNFDSVITDDGNMTDSDRIGAQYGDRSKVAFSSSEPSTLSFWLV